MGVAYGPNMDFVVGKVCMVDGSCLSSAISEAIYWAVEAGADVINMSFGDTQQVGEIEVAEGHQPAGLGIAAAVQGKGAPVGAPGQAFDLIWSQHDSASEHLVGETSEVFPDL